MAAGAAIQTTLGELCGESVVTALAIHDDLEMGVGALVEGPVVFGADRQAPGCELAPSTLTPSVRGHASRSEPNFAVGPGTPDLDARFPGLLPSVVASTAALPLMKATLKELDLGKSAQADRSSQVPETATNGLNVWDAPVFTQQVRQSLRALSPLDSAAASLISRPAVRPEPLLLDLQPRPRLGLALRDALRVQAAAMSSQLGWATRLGHAMPRPCWI